MRRKTLSNNLMSAFSMPREAAEGLITSLGFDPKVRGEALTIPELERLSAALRNR